MIILGAGMAGLLAGKYFSGRNPTIIEKQSDLPNNHSALLRFKTDKLSYLVGEPFRRVYVRKFVAYEETYADFPNPYICNQYSYKVTGQYADRSCWNLEPGYRYIAPADMIKRIADGQKIKFGVNVGIKELSKYASAGPIISTIPMPVMAKIIGAETPKFSMSNVWTLRVRVLAPMVDLYQTIYQCAEHYTVYRMSFTGNELIIEMMEKTEKPDLIVRDALEMFGLQPEAGHLMLSLIEQREQKYGKIVPIDESWRREFIYMLTRDYNIFSLGRYATWRQLLLDDLHNDLEVINSLVNAEDRRRAYNQSLAIAAKDRMQ